MHVTKKMEALRFLCSSTDQSRSIVDKAADS
jgi:hypothetical protein